MWVLKFVVALSVACLLGQQSLAAELLIPRSISQLSANLGGVRGRLVPIETGGQIDEVRTTLKINVPVNVLEAHVVNAFSWSDDQRHLYVTLTSGILSVIGENKGEIACVMGHEYGHLLARYSEKGRQDFKLFLRRFWIYQPGSPYPPTPNKAYNPQDLERYWLQDQVRPHQLEEYYADIVGMTRMKAFGYNPYDCMGLMGKLMGARPKKKLLERFVASLAEDHPLDDNRIEFLRQHLAYLKAREQRGQR